MSREALLERLITLSIKLNISYFPSIFRGSQNIKIKNKKHDTVVGFGSGKTMPKKDCEIMVKGLISQGYLDEEVIQGARVYSVVRVRSFF
jgi:superfamily II DNA helicase RecQ